MRTSNSHCSISNGIDICVQWSRNINSTMKVIPACLIRRDSEKAACNASNSLDLAIIAKMYSYMYDSPLDLLAAYKKINDMKFIIKLRISLIIYLLLFV